MDSIINVYKEKGWTSFDVTKSLRKILNEKKIGHTGTLDPEAEGVLVVVSGKATKLSGVLGANDKEYTATMLLGKATDTEDMTGNVIEEYQTEPIEGGMLFKGYQKEIPVTEKTLLETVSSFKGKISQIPPMYSAKKIDGKRLYELARAGMTVERKPSLIEIYDISVQEMDFPHVRLKIRCSRGTYIRSLIRDIGKSLGIAATMESLLRNREGDFLLKDAKKLSEIKDLLEKTQNKPSEENIKKYFRTFKLPLYTDSDTVVCFGKFDGSHLGHQTVFNEVFRLKALTGMKSAVITFSSPPESVISGKSHTLIAPSEEHLQRLRSKGFDYVFEYPSDNLNLKMTAEDFLNMLSTQLHAKWIVAGTDVKFGFQAKGNKDLLTEKGIIYGFNVKILEKQKITDDDGKIRDISSSYIRELISSGNVKKAGILLGRNYHYQGLVTEGRHIGKDLGFPTANILPKKEKAVPLEGVYMTRVLIGKTYYKGMTNIGKNPTVSGTEPRIETHILDFSGDLYGKKIRVEFIDRIRPEIKFASLEELQEQLNKDLEDVKKSDIELY